MTVSEVLFVCVHNAGRSQIAAALLDHHANGRVHVRSAGSAQADEINPAAVRYEDWEVDDPAGKSLAEVAPDPRRHRRSRQEARG